jgi:hypothetical protein
MYLFDFQPKLKKLNKSLYVNTDNVNRVSAGVFTTGIYVRAAGQSKKVEGVNTNYAQSDASRYLRELRSGQLDAFVCGVSVNFVPEYDIYDLDREKILMPGWRTIALTLVRKELCSLEKAKRVLKCNSLGESDYDRLPFAQRLQWSKGDRPERKF